MKEIINNGEISRIKPKIGGGLSGEVHLLKYKDKKYILRRCESIEISNNYLKIYNKLNKYGFLPKLIKKNKKDLIFEYIKGRHLIKKEKLNIYFQMGEINAKINKLKSEFDFEKRFKKQIKEITTGKYKLNNKVIERIKRNKVGIKPKNIFSKKKEEKIMKLFNYLRIKCKPKTSFDANDCSRSNYKIDKNGKVFFVDIEAIKPRLKGFGISKAFITTIKGKNQKKEFLKGYNSINSTKFLTEEYKDFLDLNFLIQKINYKFKIYQKDNYETSLKKLNKILLKYKYFQ